MKWKLCQDLFSMFVGIVPSKKFEFFKIFFILLFLDLGVYLVGSSANGFATEDTDADICIVISSYPVNYLNRIIFEGMYVFFRLIKDVKQLNFLK
jgi:predicted nucleotidyltransferase